MLLFDGLRCTDWLLRVAECGEYELLFILWYTSKNVNDVLELTRMPLFIAINLREHREISQWEVFKLYFLSKLQLQCVRS